MEILFKELLQTARCGGKFKESYLDKGNVDSSVQDKAMKSMPF
jgi:hypothetical protein